MDPMFVSRLAGSEVQFGLWSGTCKSSRPEQPHVTSRVLLGGTSRVSDRDSFARPIALASYRAAFTTGVVHYVPPTASHSL